MKPGISQSILLSLCTMEVKEEEDLETRLGTSPLHSLQSRSSNSPLQFQTDFHLFWSATTKDFSVREDLKHTSFNKHKRQVERYLGKDKGQGEGLHGCYTDQDETSECCERDDRLPEPCKTRRQFIEI